MRILLASLCTLALTATATAQEPAAPTAEAPGFTERCGVITTVDGVARTDLITGYSIAAATPPLHLPEGHEQARAVICARSIFLFTDNDFRVVFGLSRPFYLAVGERVLVLEMTGGHFRARTVRGQLTPDEVPSLQAALDRAQELALREMPATEGPGR